MTRATASISPSFLRITILAIVLACFAPASRLQADSHESESPGVQYRQSVMSVIGANMGAMGGIMKNRLVLPGHVAVHASQMAEMAQLIAPAFKNNISTDATDAKPEIWQDWAKFEKAIGDFEEAARNLATAAEGKDASAVGPAMKALGKSCGGCHKPFRRPKEESFKRESNQNGHDDHE